MTHGKPPAGAIESLRNDHKLLSQLAERCLAAARHGHLTQQSMLTERMCRMLALHSLITEEILYPEARKHDDELVADLLFEQQEMLAAAGRLRSLAASEPEYDVTLRGLADRVERHIGKSEAALFPLLERQIPAELLCGLALELKQRRQLLHARVGHEEHDLRAFRSTRSSHSTDLRARAA